MLVMLMVEATTDIIALDEEEGEPSSGTGKKEEIDIYYIPVTCEVHNIPLHLCLCIFTCMSRSKFRFPSHFRNIPTHICPFP